MQKLALVVALLVSCGGKKEASAPAPSPAPPPPTEEERIERACREPDGASNPYHHASELVARVAGRWASCQHPPHDLWGYEYRADGTWTRLRLEGSAWVPETKGNEEDRAGTYFIAVHGEKVPLGDAKRMADDFMFVYNMGRPPVYWGFRSAPKSAVTLTYGNVVRWVPIGE